MTVVGDAGHGDALASPPPRRHRVAAVSRLLGEVLLTMGATVLLFVGYQLFWTGVQTAQAQDELKDELVTEWAGPRPGAGLSPTTAPAPGPGTVQPAAPDVGQGIGIIRIPRFGADYAWAIVEGVRPEDLARGPGHYPGTALPGQVGNFAVAGHRATHGEPFARVEELRDGDKVVVETATTWLTYAIYKIMYPVPVDSSWALEPDPQHPGAAPSRSLLTLTTCHPRWGSTYRFLVFAELIEALPKGDGVIPPALRQGT